MDWASWSMKSIWNLYKMHGWKDVLRVDYNDPHNNAMKLHGDPKRCELTRHAILWSQICDTTKWPTVLIRKTKGKQCNFKALLCGSLYLTFTTQDNPFIHTNGFKHFSLNHLTRSKATCPLKLCSYFTFSVAARRKVSMTIGLVFYRGFTTGLIFCDVCNQFYNMTARSWSHWTFYQPR